MAEYRSPKMELRQNKSKALIVLAVMLVSAITAGWMLGAGILSFNGVLRAG